MADDIKKIIKSQMTNGDKTPSSKPSPEHVDELTERIITTFNNRKARRWYCGVIYKFGIERVEIWLARSKEGNIPAALFAHYVNEAGGYHKVSDGKSNG